MIAAAAHLDESHAAVPEAVARLRNAVAAYARAAGLAGERLDAVRLAVSETVTNVVLHAYQDGPGEVRVSARVTAGELLVLVADDGCGPSLPSPRPGLGWGLAFVTDACDRFTLAERPGGGTEASMAFRLPGGRAPGAGRQADPRSGALGQDCPPRPSQRRAHS